MCLYFFLSLFLHPFLFSSQPAKYLHVVKLFKLRTNFMTHQIPLTWTILFAAGPLLNGVTGAGLTPVDRGRVGAGPGAFLGPLSAVGGASRPSCPCRPITVN
jgi:hypothetical protein